MLPPCAQSCNTEAVPFQGWFRCFAIPMQHCCSTVAEWIAAETKEKEKKREITSYQMCRLKEMR